MYGGIPGTTERRVRPYLYVHNCGFHPRERSLYVVIRDRDGTIIGTGASCDEARRYAHETLARRRHARHARDPDPPGLRA